MTPIEALQELHRQCEEEIRTRERTGGSRDELRHLAGRIVGIRMAMRALGATHVATDTGVRPLAEYAVTTSH